MNTYNFDINYLQIAPSGLLSMASAEEMRVPLCLISSGGKSTDTVLAEAAGVHPARAAAAVSFWAAGGVLTQRATAHATEEKTNLVDEFDFRLRVDDVDEESAAEVAKVIRDEGLSDMFDECAALLGRPTLNDREIRLLTALYTQYGLDEEYILTLLSDMCTRSKCSVRALVNRAIALQGRGIDTTEKLSDYIKSAAESGEWERRTRKVLGIYSRALTQAEKQLFRKWADVYGYDEDILTLAYDKTVRAISQYSAAYMDKMLTAWYEAGCRTAAACEEYDRTHKPKPTDTTPKTGRKDKKPKERYGNFDPEEAFRKALARSYGDGVAADDGEKEKTTI